MQEQIPSNEVVQFPPVPDSHPTELLQAVREGVPQVALNRVVAICATHSLLTKHLTQLSSIDSTISQQFAERAIMQNRCQTAYQRLLALLKEKQQKINDKGKDK